MMMVRMMMMMMVVVGGLGWSLCMNNLQTSRYLLST
jgi:hypothetical protein